MKIGIDLHGVIDSDPEFFKELLKFFKSCNIETFIISGPPKVEIIEELDCLNIIEGIHYDGVYSIVDFLKEKGVYMWQDVKGGWWCDEKNWCSSKAKICFENSIYCMIDDKEMYKPTFEEMNIRFILYQTES